MGTEKKTSPNVESRLRHILRMPQEVYSASGIVVNGRRLKSFVFTTDLAIIRNCDADAVFAVYPFTPQQAISHAIIQASYIPVFCGASILNVACSTETPQVVRRIREQFPDIPIIASGGKTGESIAETIAAGANAITYTPPSPAVLFKEMMEKYRE